MPPDDDPPSPFAPVELPETGTGERSRRRLQREHGDRQPEPERERADAQPPPADAPRAPRPSRARRRAFAAAMVVLIASVPVLVYAGYSTVLNTTEGRAVDPVDDPAEPDYQANVSPTPVELVAEVASDGTLVGAVVLSLTSGAGGGALVFLPAGTVVPAAAGGGTLATAWKAGQAEGLRRAAAVVLRNGFDGVAVIDPARWAELVTAVGPLAITNPDKLPAANGAPAFASGALELAPDQVAAYVAARRPNESDLNRLARQQLVWEAWLATVAKSSSAGRIPGETTAGLGRFVAGLAAGARSTVVLPVTPVTDGSVVDGFSPRAADAASLLANVVPFPTGDQPGDRIRVRILDGVGLPGLTLAAAKVLVPAGAEVAIVGNADHFGYTTTEVLAIGDAAQPSAATMQQALGLGSVAPSEVLDDVVEVTVVLGDDFAAKAGLATTTTLAAASAGGAHG
jgi:hypothetical protein